MEFLYKVSKKEEQHGDLKDLIEKKRKYTKRKETDISNYERSVSKDLKAIPEGLRTRKKVNWQKEEETQRRESKKYCLSLSSETNEEMVILSGKKADRVFPSHNLTFIGQAFEMMYKERHPAKIHKKDLGKVYA